MPRPDLKILMPDVEPPTTESRDDGVLVLPVDGQDVSFTDSMITLPDGTEADPKELQELQEIGHGAYGRVVKAVHGGQLLAIKQVPLAINNNDNNAKRQLIREIGGLRESQCPFIVKYYGTFLHEGDLSLCMEYMDGGSLYDVYKAHGAIQEPVLSKIIVDTVRGLNYLYTEHQIIHRDVKPSNILFNSQGEIKLCDLGISGRLNNSVTQTFIGSNMYMCPERVAGMVSTYGIESDVWSLGVSIVELATGAHPFKDKCRSGALFEMLGAIVNAPAPTLPDSFPTDLCEFVAQCLEKDPARRPKYAALLDDVFVARVDAQKVDLAEWAKTVLPEHAVATPPST